MHSRKSQRIWQAGAVCLFLAVFSADAVVYVDKDAAGGGDGTSWADAYTNLAVAVAGAAGEFWVAAGTYATAASNGTEIGANEIYGGFQGNETDRGQRDWTNHVTVLDGGGVNRVLQKTTDGVAILDGLTIQNGLNGAADAGTGGGINVAAGTLQMANCVVKNNTAGQGGGIYCAVGTYTGCTFDGNRATTAPQPWSPGGGAIFCGDRGIFKDCVFTRNALTAGLGYGTVIRGGNATLLNCTMENNGPGGYLIQSGQNQSVGATNCVFSGNNCPVVMASFMASFYVDNCLVTNNAGYFIYSLYAGTTVVVEDTTFINNNVNGNSRYALIISRGNTNIISRCVFVGNTVTFASTRGGMISLQPQGGNYQTAIDTCTFVNNSVAGGAGAIALPPGFGPVTVNITACTFFKNTGGGNGGALYVSDTANVKHCIFWKDTAASGNEINANGGTVNLSYCDLDQTQVTGGTINYGDGMINKDPRFASEVAPYDVHLKSLVGRWDAARAMWVEDAESSPCIDAGDPAADWSLEPIPNGKRLNLGVYGNTAEASKSSGRGIVIILR